MQVIELKNEGLVREYKVALPAAEVNEALQNRLTNLAKKVKIKGFRPGKVPLPMIKKRYGQQALGEVLEDLIKHSSKTVIAERKLQPALRPDIKVDKFGENQDLEYHISLEVYPEVGDLSFDKIELKQLVVKATEKDIEKAIDDLVKKFKNWVAIETDRAAQLQDQVVMDYEGRIDGELFEGGAAEKAELELGSNQFIPGFEDQLVDMKKGDKKVIKVTFPDNYFRKDFSGKEAEFSVTLHEIRQSAPVELNDEFAKKFGAEDFSKLQTNVKEHIEKDFGNIAKVKMKKELFDQIDQTIKFAVPQGMVDMEYDAIAKESQANGEGNLTDEEKAELKIIAERRVRLGVIMAEVARHNNVVVTPEDIRVALFEQAKLYPGQEYKVLEYYRKNQQALDHLKGPILEEKVLKHLFEKVVKGEQDISIEALIAFYDEKQE